MTTTDTTEDARRVSRNLDAVVRCFWSSGDCEIHEGYAMAFLRESKAKSVDVICTDPPFFTPATHYQSRVSWGRAWADMSVLGEFFFQFAHEAKRVLKDSGHLLCFCHDESYPVFYPVAFGLWDFTACLIWDKTRPGMGKIFRHQHEMILWASNSGAFCESDGKLHADILRHAPTLSRYRAHPVEKPPELIEELLGILTKPGHTVLDPFMGSGTTLEAAKRRGCKAVGVEMERRYCEAAADRLDRTRVDQRAGQGQLFCTANAPAEARRSRSLQPDVGRPNQEEA